MERRLIPGDVYKHFKNKLYQIVTVAEHSETKEKYVVYQALYGDFKTYIRPYDMFMSEVDREKYPNTTQKYRFEKYVPLQNVEETVLTENIIEIQADSEPDVSGVNPYLMEFFEQRTAAEKIEYLSSIRTKIDDRLINDIAASMDLTVDAGDIDVRYSSLISCLNTMARFECGRLR